jgi:hypothetical protein
LRITTDGEIVGDRKDCCGVLFGPLVAEALPQSAAAFQRAHAPFELGKVSRARQVLVIAALFGALEPEANPCEKEGKHNNLQEVAYQ